MIKAWIGIKLRILEGCKWMVLMRVGELVAKLNQYGWMGWIRLNGGFKDKLGAIRFEGFIYQIDLFNKLGFWNQIGEQDLIDK